VKSSSPNWAPRSCARTLGITPEPREDHASYLAHSLEILLEDKRAIFSAAAYAQRAADLLHGLQLPDATAPRSAPHAA
jgi:antirestriction protein ArdC